MTDMKNAKTFFEKNDEAVVDTIEHSVEHCEIILGSISALDSHGKPLVNFIQNPSDSAIVAISTTPITQQLINRQVALLFNQGDLMQPIIVGLIHSPLQDILDNVGKQSETQKVELMGDLNIDNVKVEGKKVTFEAEDEMVFKCGESSITLTKSGKIMLRGKYLLNRSSGVNRILGGSVQIN